MRLSRARARERERLPAERNRIGSLFKTALRNPPTSLAAPARL
jgi:hypothetical protein